MKKAAFPGERDALKNEELGWNAPFGVGKPNDM
jgi:hypothetical protein